MSKYMTKQREVLLDFLSEHTDESFSAKQIADALASSDISVSAVYRNLSALEGEGKLKRTVGGSSREVLYRFSGSEHCLKSLHMSCKVCGVTSHMSAKTARQMEKLLADNEGFALDIPDTIIYGICAACRENLSA